MEFLQDFFSLIGRVLIGAVFLWAAYEKMKNWKETVEFYKTKKIPYLNIILPIGVGMKVLGGFLVILGWYAHFGAFLLLVVTISSVLKIHNFWQAHGEERQIQQYMFMKGVAITGGLFMILALGAGNFAL